MVQPKFMWVKCQSISLAWPLLWGHKISIIIIQTKTGAITNEKAHSELVEFCSWKYLHSDTSLSFAARKAEVHIGSLPMCNRVNMLHPGQVLSSSFHSENFPFQIFTQLCRETRWTIRCYNLDRASNLGWLCFLLRGLSLGQMICRYNTSKLFFHQIVCIYSVLFLCVIFYSTVCVDDMRGGRVMGQTISAMLFMRILWLSS